MKKIEEMKWKELTKEGRERKIYKVGMTRKELEKKVKADRKERGAVEETSEETEEKEEIEEKALKETPEKTSEEKKEQSWVGKHTLDRGN